MRVLLDTNVALDFLLDREPFADAAAQVWEAHRHGKIVAYVSAIAPVNIFFYIARKLKGVDMAHRVVTGLLHECQVAGVDASVLRAAAALSLKDYEDAVQLASALHSRLDAMVTRNPHDYPSDSLAILSPSDVLTTLAQPRTGDPGTAT